MPQLRFLLFISLVVATLGLWSLLRAQGQAEDPAAGEHEVYLPAVMQSSVSPTAPEQPLSAASVVHITYRSQAEVETLLATLDVFETSCGQACLVALVTPAEYQRLVDAGYPVLIDHERTAQLAASVAQVQQAFAAGEAARNTIPGYSCYRTVEESYSRLAALAAANPQIATWTDIGDSWEKVMSGGVAGYDIYVLKLTNSAIPGPKPKFFLIAAIHAREYTTAELATRFAEDLIAKYNVDADVTWLLDYVELHIVPQVNPDGRKKAETGLLWRKNTDNDDGCTTANSWGTDLNRNSSFQWNSGGSSGFACSETYRGPSAASEPETQAIQNYATAILTDQRGPNNSDAAPADAQDLFITLHSYGELVLYPWGWTTTAAPNGTHLRTLGRKFGYYNGYQVCNGPVCLYGTSGTTDDFIYGEFGTASYTFELGTDFFQACTLFTADIIPRNMPALYYAAKAARRPYQNPAGPEALNVTVSPATANQGQLTTLTATLDDTRYNSNGWGAEPVQNIMAAQYTLDAPSWAGGVPVPMNATDGAFDAAGENVIAAIDTSGLAVGRHTLFVEGQDAAGNWGVLAATFLWVNADGPTPTPTQTPTPTHTPTHTPTPTPTSPRVPGDTGLLSSSANVAQTRSAGDNNGFQTNAANAQADSGGVAQDVNSGTSNNSSCTASSKDKHHYYNYNIPLPDGVTITGLEVRLDAFVDAVGANAPRMCIQLSWDGGATWTTARQTPTLKTTEATYLLGGATDTWGRPWTATHLSNSNFRVRVINIAVNSGATARDFSLDWVAVRIHYR
ncbi:MAG: hypothetical protein DYG89_03150 [Caldilinea sp. CFX5]|nr:hypothetical protein [Caldilinea sp. CFX5]